MWLKILSRLRTFSLEAIFTLGKCSTSKGTLGNRFSLVNVSPPFYPLWSQSQYHWIHVLYDRYECLNSSMWKSQRRCTQVFSRDQVYGSPHKMLSSVNFSENVLDSNDNEFTPAILLAKIRNLFRWFSIVTRDWLDDALLSLLLNVCTNLHTYYVLWQCCPCFWPFLNNTL